MLGMLFDACTNLDGMLLRFRKPPTERLRGLGFQRHAVRFAGRGRRPLHHCRTPRDEREQDGLMGRHGDRPLGTPC